MRRGCGSLLCVLPLLSSLIPASLGAGATGPPPAAVPTGPPAEEPSAVAPPVAPSVAPGPLARVLYILPLGSGVGAEAIDLARKALTGFFDVDVRVLPAEPIPGKAWYPARRRYRAERILDYLAARIPADGYRILGITTRDISTTNRGHPDWGLLGLADYDHPVGIVSTFRCGSGGASSLSARDRLGKIAVHEIGHTFGLPHCAHAGCIMNDPDGRVSACDRGINLCSECQGRLRARGEPLLAEARPPWGVAPLDAR